MRGFIFLRVVVVSNGLTKKDMAALWGVVWAMVGIPLVFFVIFLWLMHING